MQDKAGGSRKVTFNFYPVNLAVPGQPFGTKITASQNAPGGPNRNIYTIPLPPGVYTQIGDWAVVANVDQNAGKPGSSYAAYFRVENCSANPLTEGKGSRVNMASQDAPTAAVPNPATMNASSAPNTLTVSVTSATANDTFNVLYYNANNDPPTPIPNAATQYTSTVTVNQYNSSGSGPVNPNVIGTPADVLAIIQAANGTVSTTFTVVPSGGDPRP